MAENRAVVAVVVAPIAPILVVPCDGFEPVEGAPRPLPRGGFANHRREIDEGLQGIGMAMQMLAALLQWLAPPVDQGEESAIGAIPPFLGQKFISLTGSLFIAAAL